MTIPEKDVLIKKLCKVVSDFVKVETIFGSWACQFVRAVADKSRESSGDGPKGNRILSPSHFDFSTAVCTFFSFVNKSHKFVREKKLFWLRWNHLNSSKCNLNLFLSSFSNHNFVRASDKVRCRRSWKYDSNYLWKRSLARSLRKLNWKSSAALFCFSLWWSRLFSVV